MELPKNANETASPENNAAAIPNDLPINPIENTDIGGEPVRTPSSEEVEADPDVDNYFKKAYKLPAEEIIEQEGYVGAGQTQEESDREISDFFRRGYAMPSEDGEDIPAETNFQAPSDAAKDFNETMETQLQEVAAKLNVSRDEAYAMLSDKPIEEVIKTPELNRIVKGYPKVAAWAQSTGNYKKLIKAPEKAMSIDDNMSFAGKAFSEMSKLAKVNYANLLQVSIHGMMSSGKLDRNTGITKLRELDTLIRENQSEVYAQGVQNFGKRIEVAAGKFKAGSKTIDQADFSDNSSFSDYIADLGKYAKGLGQYGGGVGEIMASVKDDPAAFAVGVAGQSMYSMLPSTIASVGVGKLATIATLNPAIGALAGLTAGTITQGIVSYGQFFQMQTEKYTDKATGLVDYDKMYSDPAVIAEMQVQAAKYAGVHAVFEMTAGRFLTVNVSKAKAAIKVAGSTGAKAKIAAKTATKVTSSTAIEESAGEFTALTATGTPVDEALKEATVEGLAGVFMGIPTASIEYLRDSGTSPGVETAKKTALKDKFKDYIKAKDTVVKAEASMAAAESVKKTAQDLTDLDLKTSRDQAQDLIDRASVMESVDTEGEAETTQSTATMSLNELNNFAAQNGIEVETLLDSMGTEAKDAYYSSVNHGLSDFSFPIHELTMAANDHPELADIAYINDAEINAVEGLEISQNSDQVIESLNRDIESILKMSDETEGVETDADLMGASDVSEVNELGETVDTVLRPVEIAFRGRTRDEMEVWQSIQKGFKASTEYSEFLGKNNREVIDASTELAFQNLKYRAETMGVSIKDLAAKKKFSGKITQGDALGQVRSRLENESGLVKIAKMFLSKKADAVTIVHELGHMWLDDISSDYVNLSVLTELNEAQKEYMEVMQIVADKIGLANMGELVNLNRTNEARRTLVQETFAQTVEEYFINGKMPSGRMYKVFSSMKKWFSSAIIAMRKIRNTYPTLVVDEKVVRVMETILRANQISDNVAEENFQGGMFDPRTLGARSEEYSNLLADAKAQATADLYGKIFNKSIKEREAAIDSALDGIYDTAAKEIANSPEMIFKRTVQSGPAEMRIRKDSFVAVIAGGDNRLANQMLKLIPGKIVAGEKKAGIDIREYMAQLGIANPAAMADFLMAGNFEDAMVNERAEELMEEMFPTFKTDEEIHNEAVKALQGTPREKLIRMELDILADKSPKKLLELAALVANPAGSINKQILLDQTEVGILHRAQMLVATTPAKNLKPAVLLATANRYGRRAAKYLAKGDFDAAFEMKEQEAVNFYGYKEALNAKKDVDRTTKLLKRYGKMTERSAARTHKLDPELITYIKTLGIMLSTNSKLPGISKDMFTNGEYLTDSFINMVNASVAYINSSITSTNNNISTESYRLLGRVIRGSAKAARSNLEMKIGVIDATVDGFSADIRDQVGPRKKGDNQFDMTKLLWEKATLSLQTVENLFAGLFRNEIEYAQSNLAAMTGLVRNAEAVLQKNKNADWKNLIKAMQAASNDKGLRNIFGAIKSKMIYFATGDVGTPVMAPEFGAGFSFKNKGEIIKAILFYGSDTGRQALFEGGLSQDPDNITPIGSVDIETGLYESASFDAFMQRAFAENIITKEDMDFIQAVWDIYEKHFEAVKTSIKDVHSFDIGKVKAMEVKTPFGTYRGGYVPLIRAITKQSQGSLLDKITMEGNVTTSELFPFFTPSMAKERSRSSQPVSLDLTSLRWDLNAVYRVAYLMPTMWRVAKVLENSDFKAAMEERRPGAMEGIIKPWAARTLGQVYSTKTESQTLQAGERVSQALRRNIPLSAFALNYVTWVKQSLGLFPASLLVSKRRLSRNMLVTLTSRDAQLQYISSLSEVMARRFEDNQTRAIQSLEDFNYNFTTLDSMRDWVEKMTFKPIQAAQNLVDSAVFLSVYEQRKSEGLTEQEAIVAAESAVERSQATSSVSGRPEILSAGGEYGRLFTAFSSQILAMFSLTKSMNQRSSDLPYINRKASALKVLLLTAIMPELLGKMISKGVLSALDLGGDDDEVEDYLTDVAMAGIKGAIDVTVPFVGNPLLASAMYVAEGNSRRAAEELMLSLPGPRAVKTVLSGASAVPDTLGLMLQDIWDGRDVNIDLRERDWQVFMESITLTTGFPASAVSRIFREIEKIEEGLED